MIKKLSPKANELKQVLLKRGYPEEICSAIAGELNTDYTAGMMLGYLGYYNCPPLEELADEMFAILDQRNRIVEKKKAEHYQQGINIMLNYGLGTEEKDS